MTSIEEPARFNETTCAGWRAALIRSGRVTPRDISKLRNLSFPLGLKRRADAEDLFRVERALLDKGPEWTRFFIEMIVDFVVWGERPTGVVSDTQASWMLDQVDLMPTLATQTLLQVIREEATCMPKWFSTAITARTGQVDLYVGTACRHAA